MLDKNKVVDVLKFGAMTSFPMGALLFKGSEVLINKAQELKENGTIDQLSEEAKKQDLYYQMLEYQAKYAQELAISQRIASAEEGNISLGASGSDRKVTKRVYRFTGFNETSLEASAGENVIAKNITYSIYNFS